MVVRKMANTTPRMVRPRPEVQKPFRMRMRTRSSQWLDFYCLASGYRKKGEGAATSCQVSTRCCAANPKEPGTGLQKRLVFAGRRKMKLHFVHEQVDRNPVIQRNPHQRG